MIRFDKSHAILVCVASVILSALFMFGFSFSDHFIFSACFVGVMLVGMPHGGLDHLVGKNLFSELRVGQPLLSFLFCYLVISSMIVASWFVWPIATIIIFFGLSAWHFGLEEEIRDRRGVVATICQIARGGMVIWLPCLFHPERVIDLLTTTVPSSFAADVHWVVDAIAAAWPIWLTLVLIDCCLFPFGKIFQIFDANWRVEARFHAVRLGVLGGLFILADPLVSFIVYFCGWHSVRGLYQLKSTFGGSWWSLIYQLLPVTVAANLFMLLGWGLASRDLGVWEATVRATFIGLSAVAIPHLMLHVLVKLVPVEARIDRGENCILTNLDGVVSISNTNTTIVWWGEGCRLG